MSPPSAKNSAVTGHSSKPRLKFPWRSLAWQLIFLTILPATALVLVIAFGSLSVHQNAMRTLVGERDERAVRAAAAALAEQLNHRLFAIRSLALLAEGVDSAKIPAILSTSNYLLPEFDGGLAFFDPQGELSQLNGDRDVWEALRGQMVPIVQNLAASGDSPGYLSGVFIHPTTSEPIVLAFAVSPTKDWIAGGAFSAAGLVEHTLTKTFASGPQASVVVFDANKRQLYQGGTFSYAGELSDHPGVAEALRGESGVEYVMISAVANRPQEEHVVAYSPIVPWGWALVLEEPWEMVASPTLRTSQLAPLVLAPVLILAVVALGFGARRIVRPLQTLESRAAMLAWGDFKAIESPVGGIEEIRQLQNELVHMAHKVQAAQASLHSYIGVITAAQEDERRRLARELHDDTMQALIALKQRIQLRQLDAASDAPESVALQEIATLTEQTIENLRRLTRALRPIYLEELGLVTALEMLARETGQALNIPLEFQRQGQEKRLDSVVELALYRMAQEACSNIARHAQASQAALQITFAPEGVTLQITDNGKGFDVPKSPAEFAPGGHYGLLGLYERAELIGARLEIRSASGMGTHVTISLPAL